VCLARCGRVVRGAYAREAEEAIEPIALPRGRRFDAERSHVSKPRDLCSTCPTAPPFACSCASGEVLERFLRVSTGENAEIVKSPREAPLNVANEPSAVRSVFANSHLAATRGAILADVVRKSPSWTSLEELCDSDGPAVLP
jgi:hypothetical protein